MEIMVSTNTQNLHRNLKRENHRERERRISLQQWWLQVEFSSALRFLDSDRPLPRWEGSVIYTGYAKQIRLGSHA